MNTRHSGCCNYNHYGGKAEEEWCDVCLVSLPSTLQLDVQGGEGLHSDQVVHHSGGVGVVGAVMEPVDGAARVLEALVPDGHI